MRPTVTDTTSSARVSLLDTTASRTKTGEPIEVPFEGMDSGRPKESCVN